MVSKGHGAGIFVADLCHETNSHSILQHKKEVINMTLLDLILGNYDEESPERKFSKLLSKEYAEHFNAEDFDNRFDGVAGYKPIQTNMLLIAKNYLMGDSSLTDNDKEYILAEFAKAYEDIADKSTVNVQAILDGIMESMDIDDADEDDEYDDVIPDDDDDEYDEDYDEED